MTFETLAMLLGIKSSAGSMKGESGETVSWDQIELHCLAPMDESKGGIGQTVQIHKWKFPGAATSSQFNELAKCVGQKIKLELRLASDGKGGAPKPVLHSASPAKAA